MTAKEIKTLKEQRGALIEKMEALTKKSEQENRAFTQAEEQEWKSLEKQVDGLDDIINNGQNEILERADSATRTGQADGSYTFSQRTSH